MANVFASTPKVTRNIIIINVVVFIATLINEEFMMRTFALFPPTSRYFHWWQLVTHMFMHGGFWHIFFNMWALWMFGSPVERTIGSKKMLWLYFVAGFGAVALHFGTMYLEGEVLLAQMAEGNVVGASQEAIQSAAKAGKTYAQLMNTPTVGASGAIYGLLMSYALLYPQSKMTLIFPPITLSAKVWVIIFAVIELFTGVSGFADGVAHFAHLGGMLFGWLMILYWKKKGTLYSDYGKC